MILDRIVADNQQELERRKLTLPLEELQGLILKQPPPLDFASALRGDDIKLIAEVKMASPSRGVIRPDFDPVQIARTYADNGAAAISVLTEPRYFRGSINHLKSVRDALSDRRLPLLRKDFLHDPYQVYESRAYGADCLLLIVANLTPRRLAELMELSHHLGMDCLVEVHSEAELQVALESNARIIGINNRDLRTLDVDLKTTRHLRPLIPADRTVVSESGIKERSDIDRLREWRVDAVLIGEALMSAPDIGARIRELI